jgi:hypothetical protein
MKQMNYYLVTATMAAALFLTAAPARAEHEKEFSRAKQVKASELIGKEVKNNQNESLGKVDELIINSSGFVPYAIIAHGGALGVGRTKTAVPMSSLECSAEGKYLTLNATKEDLKTASKMPPSNWYASDATWTKSVDGFYGQPAQFTHDYDRSDRTSDRYDRDTDKRLYVRDPQQKGAEVLMRPADAILCEKVCDSIENVQVNVNEGTVTLRGTVESEEAKRKLETRVRSIPGVQRVDNNLRVR